jgi:hypothetical protein
MMFAMDVAAERDRAVLQRRFQVLGLAAVPLRRHGLLTSGDAVATEPDPEAVGVGPDGTALAVWRFRGNARRRRVTWHAAGRRRVLGTVDVETDLRVSFVQPLPEGGVLLVDARSRAGAANAEVWTADGDLQHQGPLGDAIEEVLTTPAGAVWVGYFDEALGGSGPQGHGLARFHSDLTVDWLYPLDAGLPFIVDCYALNVAGETAYFFPYTDFHVLSVTGAQVTDHGASPYAAAHTLLRRGPDLALVGGPGPEYDLATMLRIRPNKALEQGGQCRVVLPDGMEAHGVRLFGRGDELYAFDRSRWYHLDLDTLSTAAHG